MLSPVHLDALTAFSSLAGLGAMTEWRDIVQIVVDRFNLPRRPEARS